jgi:copper chaperone NosL
MAMKWRSSILGMAVVCMVLLAACSPGPRDIDLGKEECAHCKMTVTDARFAAQLVTNTGKIHVYDAVECMAAAVNDNTVLEEDINSIWVMRHDAPGTFIDAAKAWYLRHEDIRSPMGMNLAAFETKTKYASEQQRIGGELYRWTGVRLLVAKEW